MSSPLETLRQIRSADLEISSLEGDLAKLRKGLRDCDVEAEGIRAKITKLGSSVMHRQSQLKLMELETEKLRADLENQKVMLKNSRHIKDYHELNAQVGAKAQSVAKSESQSLKFMEELETLKAESAKLESSLAEVAARRAQLEESTKGEAETIESAIAEHRQKRSLVTAGVDKAVLEDYERLYTRFGAEALVACEDGSCSGCYKDLTANLIARLRHGSELTRCPNCGRILVEEKNTAEPEPEKPAKKKSGKKS
ncbi:MAG: zinc ribbon domain-containing protein [Planctomycetota bacterium]